MNSLIVVSILSLEEDAENFCQGYHAGAGNKTVPGIKSKTTVENESLFLEIEVVMNEEFRQQSEQQNHDLNKP